jgi:hypothetical protein
MVLKGFHAACDASFWASHEAMCNEYVDTVEGFYAPFMQYERFSKGYDIICSNKLSVTGSIALFNFLTEPLFRCFSSVSTRSIFK